MPRVMKARRCNDNAYSGSPLLYAEIVVAAYQILSADAKDLKEVSAARIHHLDSHIRTILELSPFIQSWT
jgi:hypothetical protein